MAPTSTRISKGNGAGARPPNDQSEGARIPHQRGTRVQDFDFSNNVFPSEASHEEDRLVFPAVQSTSTALARNDPAHRWGHWSRHFTDDRQRCRPESAGRSEEKTSELQSPMYLVCCLLLR